VFATPQNTVNKDVVRSGIHLQKSNVAPSRQDRSTPKHRLLAVSTRPVISNCNRIAATIVEKSGEGFGAGSDIFRLRRKEASRALASEVCIAINVPGMHVLSHTSHSVTPFLLESNIIDH
jgi:hypothetical protein